MENNISLLLKGSKFINEKKYWTNKLEGFLDENKFLPYINKSNVIVKNYKAKEANIDDNLRVKMTQIAKGSDLSLFSILIASMKGLVYKYTDKEDIVISSPIYRESIDEDTINEVVPMRDKVSGSMSFKDLIFMEAKTLSEAYNNQNYPQNLMWKEFDEENCNISNLLNICCSLNTIHENSQLINEECDILFSFIVNQDKLKLVIRYDENIYCEEAINEIKNRYPIMLDSFINNLDKSINELSLVSSAEAENIVFDFNNTMHSYNKKSTIQEEFERQVEQSGDKIAIVYEDLINVEIKNEQSKDSLSESQELAQKKKSITYNELNRRINKVANYLSKLNVKPNEMVALCGEPSLDMVIAMLGIIKAGGAYVAINPEYPKERIKYIVKDTEAKILLTHKDIISEDECDITVIDAGNIEINDMDETNPYNNNQSKDLAYVIYTSGTTGKPKGVMIEHKSVLNLSNWFNQEHALNKNKNVMQMANLAFDVSVEEIIITLLNGGTLFIPNQDVKLDYEKFSSYVIQNDINIVQFVPVMLRKTLVNQKRLECLRVVICGGDRLDDELKNKILDKGYNLYNHYGPTETTVDAISTKCEYIHNNLGMPINNVQAYVLNEKNNLLPIGVIGELCISGDGLARGYHNSRDLTDKVFVKNPFIENERLYKTGDLARWTKNGTIEFIGRVDDQVKIRGFRIELQEIEKVVSEFSDLIEVIIVIKEYLGENHICAYFSSDKNIDIKNLREFLSLRLPQHMIPSYFIQIDKMPTTLNGKIDKKKLPLPSEFNNNKYESATNDIERELVEIWCEVLSLNNIGINDNFFDNGGHSLKATSLVSKIYKHFNVQIQLRDIFELDTVKLQAEYIMNTSKVKYIEIPIAEKKDYYKLSSAQKRLYFLDQLEDIDTSYNMLHTIIIEGDLDKNRLQKAFEQVIKRQEILRTSFEFIDGEVVQKIHESVEFKIINIKSSEDQLPNIIKSFTRKFDLRQAPLLRVTLIELEYRKYALLFDMHHIISDGTSMGILVKEIIETYEGRILPELKIQYTDYSEWQNNFLKDGSLDNQKNYWLKKLSGEIPILDLATDYKRSTALSFQGDVLNYTLNKELVKKLRFIEKQSKSTLYMVLLSVYYTLIYKYTDQEDVLIGSPIAGRRSIELENIVGMFVNTLVMRNYPSSEKSFEEFLKEVSKNSLEAYENQDYQFEELVDNLGLKRENNRNPLFDIAFTVQNTYEPDSDTERLGFTFRNYEAEIKTSKFDITLFVVEAGDDINFTFEYNTNLFKKETINKLLMNYLKVIDQVCDMPNIKLGDVDILSEEEKDKILNEFNNTYKEYPADKTVHELFVNQVKKTPNKVAIVHDGKIMTYMEVDIESNKLANYLIDKLEAKKGSFIGLIMDKSINTIVSIIGILKTGAAYVPIDPEYPEERIKTIINDSKIRTILSCKNRIGMLNRLQWECQGFKTYLCMDSYNVYDEYEQQNILMSEELWKYVGDKATDEITGGGWGNSYTGEDLSKAEMDEYGDNILKKLKPYLNKNTRVLEIGCASGISMFRIAPHVGLYYGTDLSKIIIDKDKDKVLKEDIKNIKLKAVPAHEIDKIEDNDFDIVILNSVIQTFSGYNYLRDVIKKIINKMSASGIIFIGDIMDQDLKKDLIQSLIDFKEKNSGKGYRTKVDWSSELFISKDFIEDLMADLGMIENVQFSNKIYTIENELTMYRYDAILKINKKIDTSIVLKYKYQLGRDALDKYSSKPVIKQGNANDLYCVIYTSGSTGRPKGTLITHRNVVRVVKDTNYVDLTEKDTLLQLANYAFDASLFEIHGALLNGGKLVLVNKESALDIIKLTEIITKEKITVTFLTTALFNTIVDTNVRCFTSVKKILFGGERISVNHARKALDYLGREKLIHVYGPTESTVFATYYPINDIEENADNIPIGRPISNTKVYVIKNARIQPIDIPGELCIAGDGIAKGYLNNETLTKEKFIENPFEKNTIMYRTGDIVRWLDGGQIEFLDRVDQQVKIRGFRIELGEIESVLIRHESISEAIVIDKKDEFENKYLCAFIIAKNNLNDMDIIKYLSKELPDYMVPKYFIQLKKFPMNENGKVNKKVLLDMECRHSNKNNYEAAKDSIEEDLMVIWEEILGVKNIGVNEKFFDIGGHSLKSAIMANKIYQHFNISFPLSDLFKNPSIREVGDKIKELQAGNSNLINKDIVLLKEGKFKEKNIFFIHTATNSVECYAKLSRQLSEEFNCWGIKMEPFDKYSSKSINIEDIARDHVQRIKSIQKEGPYYISGWCIAGIIAFEVAKQLEYMNEKVEFLGLINSPIIKQNRLGLKLIPKVKYLNEEESKIFKNVIKETKFEDKYKGLIVNNNIWDEFIMGLDSSNSYELEKQIIFNNICSYEPHCEYLISNYKSISLKEIILTFNCIRSLIDAIYYKYLLNGKLNTDIHYYVAKKSEVKNRRLWNNYTNKSLILHDIDSEHFEIFDGIEGYCLCQEFNRAIR